MSDHRPSPARSVGDSATRGETDPGRFDGLSLPPRTVSARVRWRLMLFRLASCRFACCFGAMATLIGLIFVLAGNSDAVDSGDMPTPVVGWGVLLLAAGIWSGIVAVVLSATGKIIRVLIWGEPAEGRIERIFAAGLGKYQAWADVIGPIARHHGNVDSFGLLKVFFGGPFRNWPVKFCVTDPQGQEQEIDGRINLEPWATHEAADPHVLLLVDRRRDPAACIVPEQFDWLTRSNSGGLTVRSPRRSVDVGVGSALAAALWVVVPTYCLSALGLAFTVQPLFSLPGDAGISALLGAVIVVMFTLTHGVVPVFFYRFFVRALQVVTRRMESARDDWPRPNPLPRLVSGFVHVHMVVWFGAPMILLGMLSGWISLAWGLLHVLLAARDRRRWIFLEYGSTSMALVLFILFFSGKTLLPLGILVVLFQSGLLTIVEWKGKHLWLPPAPPAAGRRWEDG